MKILNTIKSTALKASLISGLTLLGAMQGYGAQFTHNITNGTVGSPLTLNQIGLTYSVPKFDSSLGTLTSIDFTFNGTVAGDKKMESQDATATNGNILTLSASFNIDDPLAAGNLLFASAQDQTFHNLGAFDGTVDFGGASGVTVSGVSASDSDSFTDTSAGGLAHFTGTGNVDLNGNFIGTSFASGPSSVQSEFTALGYADLEVVYNYTEAPEGSVPFGFDPMIGLSILGAVGGYEVRRRRNKAAKTE